MAEKSSEISAFGLISQIYQSELSLGIKNDCACRVLAHRFNADAVTIMLYDGENDKVINRGNYIHEHSLEYKGLEPELEIQRRHLLKYISFYDFLYYKFYYTGIPREISDVELATHIAEFSSEKSSHFTFMFGLDEIDINLSFARKCVENSIILATDNLQDSSDPHRLTETSFYYKYKREFPNEEEYIIGDTENSYTGRVFYKSMKNIIFDKNKVFYFANDLLDIGESQEVMERINNHFYKRLKETCGYRLKDRGNFRYCGIPLRTGNRCIGVIRMLIHADKVAQFEEVNLRSKSLRHVVEVLCNFLDQTYAQEFVDRIMHDWSAKGEFDSSLQSDQEKMSDINNKDEVDNSDDNWRNNAFCNSMRKAINSFGCILRLECDDHQIRIVGKATKSTHFSGFVEQTLEIRKYDGFIKNGAFPRHVYNYFSSYSYTDEKLVDEKYRLIGIGITLSFDEKIPHKGKYYYCHTATKYHKESEQLRETDGTFIFKHGAAPDLTAYFHPKAIEGFKNINSKNNGNSHPLSIKHVLIMDIPALDVDGLMTFANTPNRSFNIADVRFAYGEMKRLGLEKSRVNKERLKVFKENVYEFMHDSINNMRICIGQISNLRNALNRGENIVKDIERLNGFMQLLQNQIEYYGFRQKLIELGKAIESRESTQWDLKKQLRNLCLIMSDVGDSYKSTKVTFKTDGKHYNTHANRKIIELCFFNLLENALKYSFGEHASKKPKGYDKYKANSPGHVHVLLSMSDENYVIKITNWGLYIPNSIEEMQSENYKNKVKQFLVDENRPKTITNVPYFLWQNTTGKGLMAVNKFVSIVGGNCTYKIDEDNHKTTFTLQFKKMI